MRNLYFYLLVVVLGVGCGRVERKNVNENDCPFPFNLCCCGGGSNDQNEPDDIDHIDQRRNSVDNNGQHNKNDQHKLTEIVYDTEQKNESDDENNNDKLSESSGHEQNDYGLSENKNNPSKLEYSHFKKKDHYLIKKFVDEYNRVLSELKNNQSNNKPTEQLFTVWYDKFQKSLIKKSLKNLFFAKNNCCNNWALKSDKNNIKNFFNKLFVHIDIYINSVYEAKFKKLNTDINLNDSRYLVNKITWQRANDERKKYHNVFLQTTAPSCSYQEYKIGDKIKYYDLTATSLEVRIGTIQEIEKPEPKYIDKLGYFVYEDSVKINSNGDTNYVCSNNIIVKEEDFEEKDELFQRDIQLDKGYKCTLNIKPQGIQSHHTHSNTCFIISILHFLNKSNNMILSEQQVIQLSKSIYKKIYQKQNLFKKPNLLANLGGDFNFNVYGEINDVKGLIESGCITKSIFDNIYQEYNNACVNKRQLSSYDLKNLYVYKEVGDQEIHLYPVSKYDQIADYKISLAESLSHIKQILKQDVISVSFIILPQVGHWYFCDIHKSDKKIIVNVRDGKLKNCYRSMNKWNNNDILHVDYLSHSIKKLLNEILS